MQVRLSLRCRPRPLLTSRSRLMTYKRLISKFKRLVSVGEANISVSVSGFNVSSPPFLTRLIIPMLFDTFCLAIDMWSFHVDDWCIYVCMYLICQMQTADKATTKQRTQWQDSKAQHALTTYMITPGNLVFRPRQSSVRVITTENSCAW